MQTNAHDTRTPLLTFEMAARFNHATRWELLTQFHTILSCHDATAADRWRAEQSIQAIERAMESNVVGICGTG